MPARTGANKGQNDLVPKITSALPLRWDINEHRKLVVYTPEAVLVVLGFSAVTQHLKFDALVGGQKLEVRVVNQLCV